MNKVLIAYNGSLESAKAMKQFLQTPLWQRLETHLACIGAPKSGEDARLLLFDATDYARSHGVEPHVANPPPGESAWQTLLDHAGEIGADAIVLGSSYRRMLISQRFGRKRERSSADSRQRAHRSGGNAPASQHSCHFRVI